jgi:hypothetical protein
LGIILRFLKHDVIEIGSVFVVRCEEGYIPIQFGTSKRAGLLGRRKRVKEF